MSTDYNALREERLATISGASRASIESIARLPEMGVEGVRTHFDQLSRSMPLTPGVSIRDVQIDGPQGSVPTRIYTPEGCTSAGVVMHVHHGGYIAVGGIDTLDGWNTKMAAAVGGTVVAPDFRLPPEHRFPAGLDDCWSVLNWIPAQDEFEGLPIAVGGGCTGGNFAAVLALMARDAGGPDVALQFLEAFVADARCDTASQREFGVGYGLEHSDNSWVVEQYLSEPTDRYDWRVSPVLAASVRGVAPASICVGEWDIFLDEDTQYANRLRDANVDVELHVLKRQAHFPGPEDMAEREEVRFGALRRAFSGTATHG